MTNLVSSRAIDNGCELIEKLFEQAFFSSYQTVLKGGAEEPLYQPSEKKSVPHTIYYREDYLASALHEVAHWCLAGEVRRQQLDFGYWYQPDGRTAEEQRLFEKVEVKPQALEWIFSQAAGVSFQVSADNLAGETGASDNFIQAVSEQAQLWCAKGLPERADQFVQSLACEFVVEYSEVLSAQRYQRLPSKVEVLEATAN